MSVDVCAFFLKVVLISRVQNEKRSDDEASTLFEKLQGVGSGVPRKGGEVLLTPPPKLDIIIQIK